MSGLTEISTFQTVMLIMTAAGYVYSLGKVVNKINNIEHRVVKLESSCEEVGKHYLLTHPEALKYLHTHTQKCVSIART